jgi:hypothetical protein
VVRLRLDFAFTAGASFFITHTLMQNDPDQATKPARMIIYHLASHMGEWV